MSREQRGVDRIITFSDGVVAIAITLLVLPLTGIEPSDYGSFGELLVANEARLVSFAVSFLVIAVFWLSHHRIFTRVASFSGGLVWANFAWLACIVVLPFPTAMVQEKADRGYTLFYLGTLLLTAVMTKVLAVVVARDPTLTTGPLDAEARAGAVRGWLIIAGFALAFAVAMVSPRAGLYSLFLLALAGPLTALILRRSPGEPTADPPSA